jgi:hypothetical protein
MSLCKNRPKCSPNVFGQKNTQSKNTIHNYCWEKVALKNGASFTKFTNLQKTAQNRTIGESGHPVRDEKVAFLVCSNDPS